MSDELAGVPTPPADTPGSSAGAATIWARTRRTVAEGKWSLRRRLAYSFALAGLLLAAGCAIGGFALHSMINAVNLQVNRLDPAASQTSNLLNSVLNEETGVRGYILTGNRSFLQPYYQGVRQQSTQLASLQALVGQDAKLRGDLADVTSNIDAWRAGYANPAMSAVKAHHTPGTSFELAGKSRFNTIRDSVSRLRDGIRSEREANVRRLHSATSLVIIVAITAAALLILAAAVAWIAFNAWVIRPLARLDKQAQVVASGGLNHELKVSGPRELMELAADVEAMRRQLLRSMDDLRFNAAELQRSNRELEQFAYVASHDLQEPLRKVASFCQMLESRYAGQLDDRAKQYIFYAVDGAKRMQILISELLTFSRVGHPGMQRGPVNLNDAAHQAVDSLEATIEDTDAEVLVEQLPTVSGDETLLTQLFQNLIGNSIKFRRVDERPEIRISADRKNGYWEFACSDNGVGIAPAYAERVFVIFQRLHPRDAYPGTGIGLALCRKIVDFHGGQIWVDQQAGSEPGTTIRWTLPAGDDY